MSKLLRGNSAVLLRNSSLTSVTCPRLKGSKERTLLTTAATLRSYLEGPLDSKSSDFQHPGTLEGYISLSLRLCCPLKLRFSGRLGLRCCVLSCGWPGSRRELLERPFCLVLSRSRTPRPAPASLLSGFRCL